MGMNAQCGWLVKGRHGAVLTFMNGLKRLRTGPAPVLSYNALEKCILNNFSFNQVSFTESKKFYWLDSDFSNKV